jgi:CheY-like chemotaxis protein
VDDDTEVIDPVVEPLVEDGHKIERIRTVRDALDSIETLRESDLILMDMIVPPGDDEEDEAGYTGPQLLRSLREEHGVTMPAIVFSVVDQKKVENELVGLNVVEYIRKPALPTELKRAVDEVLGVQRDPGSGV